MPQKQFTEAPTNPVDAAGEHEQDAASAAQSREAWAEIGRRIEHQLRQDAARLVGAREADDWADIQRTLVGRFRERATTLDRTEIGRRVEEVGRQLEEQMRSALASGLGAGREADWTVIGRTIRERVEQRLDPDRSPFPGGGGRGASLEEANVPAAPPSPDRGPRPASAGGEDSGLPTVVEEVNKLPGDKE